MNQLSDIKQRKLIRAIERRFGASIAGYKFWLADALFEVWECEDSETGSSILGRFEGGRLRVISERDHS
jgi:hypothetical protein